MDIINWCIEYADRHSKKKPKYIFYMIGDGMGFEHVRAAGMYLNGTAGTLSFESLPYQGQVGTDAYGGVTTDSAAAATATSTRPIAWKGH